MKTEQVNYARLDWQLDVRNKRWAARVKGRSPQLLCQDCGGAGGETDVTLDDGTSPWNPCGWCLGVGLVDAWTRGVWLREKRDEKRIKAARAASVRGIVNA